MNWSWTISENLISHFTDDKDIMKGSGSQICAEWLLMIWLGNSFRNRCICNFILSTFLHITKQHTILAFWVEEWRKTKISWDQKGIRIIEKSIRTNFCSLLFGNKEYENQWSPFLRHRKSNSVDTPTYSKIFFVRAFYMNYCLVYCFYCSKFLQISGLIKAQLRTMVDEKIFVPFYYWRCLFLFNSRSTKSILSIGILCLSIKSDISIVLTCIVLIKKELCGSILEKEIMKWKTKPSGL